MPALQAYVLKTTDQPSPLGWAKGSGAFSAKDQTLRDPRYRGAPNARPLYLAPKGSDSKAQPNGLGSGSATDRGL